MKLFITLSVSEKKNVLLSLKFSFFLFYGVQLNATTLGSRAASSNNEFCQPFFIKLCLESRFHAISFVVQCTKINIRIIQSQYFEHPARSTREKIQTLNSQKPTIVLFWSLLPMNYSYNRISYAPRVLLDLIIFYLLL